MLSKINHFYFSYFLQYFPDIFIFLFLQECCSQCECIIFWALIYLPFKLNAAGYIILGSKLFSINHLKIITHFFLYIWYCYWEFWCQSESYYHVRAFLEAFISFWGYKGILVFLYVKCIVLYESFPPEVFNLALIIWNSLSFSQISPPMSMYLSIYLCLYLFSFSSSVTCVLCLLPST